MAHQREEIAGFRFRLGAVLAARFCLQWFFAWTMIWATAVIVLRVFLRVEVPMLLWGALGYVPAAVIALLVAKRWLPTAAAVRALLDRHAAMGGLVMAAGETEIGDWRQQISKLPQPSVRLQAHLPGGMLFCAVALLAAALLVPNDYLPSPTSAGESLHLDTEVRQVAEKIDLLKQERILPQEKALALEKDLEQLRQEASGKDPAKTMEAIDHLEQSFHKTAEEAKQEAMQHAEKSSHAEELADALKKCEGQMDSKQFDEAMKELAKMTDQAASECESLSQEMEDQLKEACKNGKLSSKQLDQLSKALKQCKACERGKIAKMAKGHLIDPNDLIQCDKACEGDCEKLAVCLKACKDGDDLAALLAQCEEGDLGLMDDGNPGKGGRGGGGPPAAMTWSKGTDRAGARFRESVLPSAAVASLKKSQLAGVSVGQPRAQAPGHGSSGGALVSANAGAGSARTQVILPEHARTVNRYFSREGKK